MTPAEDREALKILIIDDDSFMRRTIKAMLRGVGRFLVSEADDGDTGLQEVVRFKPDLVLCDIHMPRMDGLHFVEHLRSHQDQSLRAIPVVILTVEAAQETILGASRLRVSGYLLKPVSAKQIAARVGAIFGHQAIKPHA
jgi:two-component system chemotaxis response regulator CheY